MGRKGKVAITSLQVSYSAWYKFQEGPGNIAQDYSGSGNCGQIIGSTYVSGKKGGTSALQFDGISDYFQVNADFSSSTTTPIAVSSFIKPIALTQPNDWHYYFGFAGCNSGILQMTGNNIYSELRRADCTLNTYLVISSPISTWYNVIWQWDSGIHEVWVDNVKVVNQNVADHYNWGARFNMSTCPHVPGTGCYNNCQIGETIIRTDRAFTPSEIAKIYTDSI